MAQDQVREGSRGCVQPANAGKCWKIQKGEMVWNTTTLLSVYHSLYKHFKLCWDRTYIKCKKSILTLRAYLIECLLEQRMLINLIQLFIVTLYHKNLQCWRYFETMILKDWIPFWPSASYCIPSAVCSCPLFSLTVLCTEHNCRYRVVCIWLYP